MKKIILILNVLITGSVYAQKMPSDYFEKAEEYMEDEKYRKALKEYKFVVNHYPENYLYPKALYNVGYFYFDMKNYSKAIPIFKKILQSNFDDKEESGRDIMGNPYANYHHDACEMLSEIYYKKKKYTLALQYLALSDTVYPYMHFCGNAHASNNIYMALRYAEIYQKLQQQNKAIEKLLPAIFITLDDNSEIIEELRKLFSGEKNLKNEFDISLNQMYSKEFIINNNVYTNYYIRFLNVEIRVPENYGFERKEFNKEEKINEIKQVPFYKMLEQLD